MTYEIQDINLKTFKHGFNYSQCKRKYQEYANMDIEEFKKCLADNQKLGEIGHLCCFILWIKNLPQYEYKFQFSDYGLIHLLFHCVENKDEINQRAQMIKQLFDKEIKLT